MIALHQDTPADRAMTPDGVLQEIIGATAGKSRRWVLERIPRECRWCIGIKMNPPLYSELRTKAWWAGRKAS